MYSITSHIDIDAPVERVWAALTDLQGYATWHPFIRHITGRLRGGDVLDVRLNLPDSREPTVTFTVTEVRRYQRLLLVAHTPETGEPMCEYQVSIEQIAETRTRVDQWARCSDGLAARLAYAPDVDVQGDFDRAAERLKQQAENLALASTPEHQVAGSVRLVSRAADTVRGRPSRMQACLRMFSPRHAAASAVA